MSHLDEGTLQGYLDHEIDGRQRSAVAEHLIACRECRDTLDELREARAVFSGAMEELDAALPSAGGTPVRRAAGHGGEPAEPVRDARDAERGRSGRSFVRAAGLVLLLAAAASAAVPGSPVRAWLISAFGVGPDAPAVVESAEPLDGAEAALPAGVALSDVGDRVTVEVSGLRGGAIRLVETGSRTVSVRALGGERDPVFRTGAGRIEVRGGAGGELTVSWPSSMRDARLVVDGRLYAARVDGALQVLVDPAAELGGALVWR